MVELHDPFEADDFEDWGATGTGDNWTVEDDEIVLRGTGGGNLFTYQTYEDFEFTIEFQLTEGANSGVFLRCSDLESPPQGAIEVQLLDTYGDEEVGRHTCGGLYDLVAPAQNVVNPPGEWNRLHVKCEGPYYVGELNGENVFDVDIDRWDVPGRNPDGSENKFDHAWADSPREGHIGLQDHGDDLRFRNIEIREIRSGRR